MVTVICKMCRLEFLVRPYRLKTARFCSFKCSASFYASLRRDKHGPVKHCMNCGEEFYKPLRYSWKQWDTRKFCSDACIPKLPPRECAANGCNRILPGGTGRFCTRHRGRIRRHGDTDTVLCELHGLTRSPEYSAWAGMIGRCSNPRNPKWHRYGGRGISVCLEWRSSFLAFFQHIGPRPRVGLTLDRIDNDGNYEPGNVRWATRRQQQGNSCKAKPTLFRGEILPISEIARRVGLYPALINNRITAGWDVERAATTPPGRYLQGNRTDVARP